MSRHLPVPWTRKRAGNPENPSGSHRGQGTPLHMPCSIDAINTRHANSLVHIGLRPNVDLCTLSVLGCMQSSCWTLIHCLVSSHGQRCLSTLHGTISLRTHRTPHAAHLHTVSSEKQSVARGVCAVPCWLARCANLCIVCSGVVREYE